MQEDQKDSTKLDQLPREPIQRLTEPFNRFLEFEAAGGAILFICTVIALALANSPWVHPFLEVWETPVGIRVGTFDFVRSLKEWINDGLMTFFFFLVAVELKRELVLGELRSPRMAALSIAAALGGMIVPAGLYLLLQSGEIGESGWGTVMATDTAFVIGCLALLGRRIPHGLRIFMLSLAIVDDIGAILVVAIGYSSAISWQALTLGALGVVAVWILMLIGVRSVLIYFVASCLIWLIVDSSGIHATITGVVLGLLTPTKRWISDQRLYAILDRVVAYPATSQGSGRTRDRQSLQTAEEAARETLSPAERFQIALHPWVGFVIMPLFALANAGFPLKIIDPGDSIALAVFVGFVFGKPIGILLFSWLAVSLKIATRPEDLSWGLLAGGGLLAGIGFTMALFIASLAYDETLINQAKLGIFLASATSALSGLLMLICITRKPNHEKVGRE